MERSPLDLTIVELRGDPSLYQDTEGTGAAVTSQLREEEGPE